MGDIDILHLKVYNSKCQEVLKRKAVVTMKHNDRNKEVENMTNKQTLGLLEAIKIIAELASTTDEVIQAIDRIQGKIKEPTPTTK